MRELELYDVINKHFDRKFEPLLFRAACAVFSDCLNYDVQQEEKGVTPVLDRLCDAYPDFARHFLTMERRRVHPVAAGNTLTGDRE
jgi:hypothetical protein